MVIYLINKENLKIKKVYTKFGEALKNYPDIKKMHIKPYSLFKDHIDVIICYHNTPIYSCNNLKLNKKIHPLENSRMILYINENTNEIIAWSYLSKFCKDDFDFYTKTYYYKRTNYVYLFIKNKYRRIGLAGDLLKEWVEKFPNKKFIVSPHDKKSESFFNKFLLENKQFSSYIEKESNEEEFY